MRRWLRYLGISALVVLILGLGVAGGVVLDREVLAAFLPLGVIPADAAPEFRLMAEAWNAVHQNYVDRTAVQPQRLIYGAIGGMIDSLGDTGHSRFMDPQRVQDERNIAQGQFEGVGLYVGLKEGHVVIQSPIEGSPAQEAGLRPGDIIMKVDGSAIADLPLDQVTHLIMGPEGTSVTLSVLSPDTGQTRDVTLVRARITLHSVTWTRLPGTTVAHLRVTAFSLGVTQDLRAALAEIQQQELTGIVLDLRNDPGGLLEESVGTASQFLPSGNVLLEKDAQGQVQPVPAQPGGAAPDIAMTVLINGGTASAAEIVAGALQDAQRAVLVGETTFGTGTVLGEFHLSDGSALLLATQEWLTPHGRVIWHQGLAPDVTVAMPVGAEPLFPLAEQQMTPAQFQGSGDAQLMKALELLGSE